VTNSIFFAGVGGFSAGRLSPTAAKALANVDL